jgi:hypothetical protein
MRISRGSFELGVEEGWRRIGLSLAILAVLALADAINSNALSIGSPPGFWNHGTTHPVHHFGGRYGMFAMESLYRGSVSAAVFSILYIICIDYFWLRGFEEFLV